MKASLKPLIHALRLYWFAAVIYEIYRLLFKPHTHGALVALWHQDQVLLVKTSYRRSWSLPGGGIQGGESAAQAACRELFEELGFHVLQEQLSTAWTITETSSGGLNTVSIFTLTVYERPELEIDNMEIVASLWLSREEALAKHLPSHLRLYLEAEEAMTIEVDA
jgi:8-oxo-dGTP pyrophosphatase MutT (NUDIX family)